MTGPLVSVIVPVYNVERYLPQCLESIVRQTYSSLEIILVDDGSTDGSPALCDEWTKRDPRIRVIHQQNGGLSQARNTALDAMTGDYVTMIDGDDHVEETFVETLLNCLTEHHADIAVCEWNMYQDGKLPKHTKQQHADTIVYSREEAINAVFYQDTLTNSACSRLYDAQLWKDIRFPKGLLYEDLAVVYHVLQLTTKVVFCPQVLYFYLQRPESITGTFTQERTHVLDILDELEQTIEPQYKKAVQSRRLSAHFNILLLCPKDKQYDHIRNRCWECIKQLRWGGLNDPNVRRKNKLGILCSYLGKRIFIALFARH